MLYLFAFNEYIINLILMKSSNVLLHILNNFVYCLDYALDICEDRYVAIPSSQFVFLTTPSPDTAAGKASCSCDFKPVNQQLFTQHITLVRQRMAHFFNNEYFLYRPAGQNGWSDAPPDNPVYLSMNRTHTFGVNLNKFTVVFTDNMQLSAQSTVYVKLTSSEFIY